MKRCLILLFLGAVLGAQGPLPVTIADISGDGAVHAVAASGTALTITFISPPTNSTATCGASAVSGCVRVGDANISTSRGAFILPGSSATYREDPGAQRITLSSYYYLVQSGDKITISYVR